MGHPHGLFSWVDVAADDVDSAQEFYTRLFGLEATRDPIDGGGFYVMLRKDGKAVAGIGGKPDPEMPSIWNSYIAVTDVDTTVASVTDLGGQVVAPPFDVMDAGRMAVISDPTGAFVSLWQAGTHAGGEAFNEHGTPTWNELATRDIDSARAFYAGLLGWDYSEMDMGDAGTYYVAMVADEGEPRVNGGMMDMTGMLPDDVPDHWDVYFHVDDVDVTVELAKELGASVVVDLMDVPVGRIAYLADPQGAMFYVMTPAEQ